MNTIQCHACQSPDVTSQPIAEVQAQIARVDTKASILAGLSLAALTGGSALAGKAHLHGVAVVAAVLAAAPVVAALVRLGAALRPALGGNYGFVRWASLPGVLALRHHLLHADPDADGVEQLWLLARSARRKYLRVRQAVDLLGTAMAFAALAAILCGLGW